jgi:hypothetical protein
MSAKASPKRWLRKRQVRARYGDITDRTVERMVKDGRLPKPKFPLGNRLPFWDEQTLDEHDRVVVRGGNACLMLPKQDVGTGDSAAPLITRTPPERAG